jgi:hypothetical protein
MTLSIPGLIGAGVGLLCALVAYVVMSPELKRREAAASTSTVNDSAVPSVSVVRLILLADFVVLAAIGYYVGQLLG